MVTALRPEILVGGPQVIIYLTEEQLLNMSIEVFHRVVALQVGYQRDLQRIAGFSSSEPKIIYKCPRPTCDDQLIADTGCVRCADKKCGFVGANRREHPAWSTVPSIPQARLLAS